MIPSSFLASLYLNRIDPILWARVANQLGKEHDTAIKQQTKERPGGILMIQIVNHKEPELTNGGLLKIGEPGLGFTDKTFFAAEKIRRIRFWREQGVLHHFASQSTDPSNEKWGGAVMGIIDSGVDGFLSYSGAPPLVDEALCYIFAQDEAWGVPQEFAEKNPWVKRGRYLFSVNRNQVGQHFDEFRIE